MQTLTLPGAEPRCVERERRQAHPFSELLLALGLVWPVIAAHALAPTRWTLLGFALARAELVPEPTVMRDDAVELGPVATAEGSALSPAAAAIDRPPLDTATQRILLCGDSMVENLMLRLADYCLESGHELRPAIWYASTTTDWARGPQLAQLLAEFDPTFVIVALGSSELTMQRSERAAPAIRAIVKRLGSRKFIWIGPPNWREDTGINALLGEIVGPGRFFRSADLSYRRTADGIHPTRQSAAEWMDAVAVWNARTSDVPIRLDLPVGSAPRPAARVFPPPR